ncbi:nucleoside 2-deoxyribosyltransferase [Candidatus Woesearchaeota archaeon]|nr:nucleoside 2-deoxyribosyltransferase [Candidatus Woesearchaeota archaeon]
MKIYFSGSIRAGRQLQPVYFELIQYLKVFGDVLTEHIADPNLTIEGEKNISDSDIYLRDMRWIEEADIFIADVTVPSLGVGYEIRYAEQLGIPILCLFSNDAVRIDAVRISGMIQGNPNFAKKQYKNANEAKQHVSDFIKSLG